MSPETSAHPRGPAFLKDPLKDKPEFFALNGMRIGAALWVLLFHINLHLGSLEILSLVQPFIERGAMAMTTFFVLSGFILSHRYKSFQSQEDYRQFFASRIARLYPVYLFMGLVTVWRIPEAWEHFYVVKSLGPLGAGLFIAVSALMFVLALQAWLPSLFAVWNFGGSWSLSAEAFFYALFPKVRNAMGAFTDRTLRFIVFGMPLLLFIIVCTQVVSNRWFIDAIIFYSMPIYRLPEFLFGVAGFILFVERGRNRQLLRRLGWVFTALLVVAICLKDLPGLLDWTFLSIIPFMALFVSSMQWSAPEWMRRIVNYLGRVSYCLYLAQFLTLPILKHYKDLLPVGALWSLGLGSTMLFAIFSYHFIEVAAYTKTRALALRWSRNLSEWITGNKASVTL